MKCTVRRVAKNQRYRILLIEGEKYVLDMGGSSLWRMLFPFLYWILPNRVYKVENTEIVEELMAPTIKQKLDFSTYGWIAGLSMVLGNLLSPLIDYFVFDTSVRTNKIIMSILFTFIFLFIFFVNRMFKKRVYQTVELHKLPRSWLWIRPTSFKSVILTLWVYSACSVFTFLGVIAFIDYGNWFILIMTNVTLFFAVGFAGIAAIIEGDTRVLFLNRKNGGPRNGL